MSLATIILYVLFFCPLCNWTVNNLSNPPIKVTKLKPIFIKNVSNKFCSFFIFPSLSLLLILNNSFNIISSIIFLKLLKSDLISLNG